MVRFLPLEFPCGCVTRNHFGDCGRSIQNSLCPAHHALHRDIEEKCEAADIPDCTAVAIGLVEENGSVPRCSCPNCEVVRGFNGDFAGAWQFLARLNARRRKRSGPQ